MAIAARPAAEATPTEIPATCAVLRPLEELPPWPSFLLSDPVLELESSPAGISGTASPGLDVPVEVARVPVENPEVAPDEGALVGDGDVSVAKVGCDDAGLVKVRMEVAMAVVPPPVLVRVVVRGGKEMTPGPEGGRRRVAVKTVFVARMALGLPLHMLKAWFKLASVSVSLDPRFLCVRVGLSWRLLTAGLFV